MHDRKPQFIEGYDSNIVRGMVQTDKAANRFPPSNIDTIMQILTDKELVAYVNTFSANSVGHIMETVDMAHRIVYRVEALTLRHVSSTELSSATNILKKSR